NPYTALLLYAIPGWKSSGGGRGKYHRGPHPLLRVLDGAGCAAALQNHAHQVEAQAAAAGAPAAGALLPVEGIKEMGQGAVGDVDAGVFHLQNGDTPLRPDGDAHLGPL